MVLKGREMLHEQGLGAFRIMGNENDLAKHFPSGVEKRLCYHLKETEEILALVNKTSNQNKTDLQEFQDLKSQFPRIDKVIQL
jgi:hypothetical protein